MAPARGLAFPRTRLSGRLDVDIIVLGGGLTAGLAAAWLARAGQRLAIVTTGGFGDEAACGLGHVATVPAVRASEARPVLGLRATRAIWTQTRRAGLDLMASLTRWKAPSGLQRVPSFLVGSDDGEAVVLERELAALDACGSPGTWVGPQRVASLLGLERTVAVRLSDDDGILDPVRATLASVRAAVAGGAIAIEYVGIDAVARTRTGVTIHAGRHAIAAPLILVATADLPDAYGALRRHLAAPCVATCALDGLPAAARRRLGAQAVCETIGQGRVAWRQTADGGVVIARAVGESAMPADTAGVMALTGELMYDFTLQHPHVSGAQPASRWVRPMLTGCDDLPVAGLHRAFPGHAFAFARADRLAECALAARVAVATLGGDDHPAAAWLDFARVR